MKSLDELLVCEKNISNSSFVLFRLPHTEEYQVILQQNPPKTFLDLNEIDGLKGFLIAPFNPSNTSPYIFLEGQTLTIKQSGKTKDFTLGIQEITDNGRGSYEKAFKEIQEELQIKKYKKIVLARTEEVELNKYTLSHIISTFQKACRIYPNSYVALWNTPTTGLWLTATPELLLRKNEDHWESMALAGTMSIEDKEYLRLSNWSDKNKREQEYVSQYIEEQLITHTNHLCKSDTYPTTCGKLIHLRTDFKFQINETSSPLKVLINLHPTPAICGIPTIETHNTIIKNEQVPRKYYCGFSGPLNQSEISFYVTLRCLNINKSKAVFYAGGGILPESKLQEEWEETERKLNTMKDLFEE